MSESSSSKVQQFASLTITGYAVPDAWSVIMALNASNSRPDDMYLVKEMAAAVPDGIKGAGVGDMGAEQSECDNSSSGVERAT